jgi:hypothetical protein
LLDLAGPPISVEGVLWLAQKKPSESIAATFRTSVQEDNFTLLPGDSIDRKKIFLLKRRIQYVQSCATLITSDMKSTASW